MEYVAGTPVEFLVETRRWDPAWNSMVVGLEWTPAVVLTKHAPRDVAAGCKPFFVRTLDARCGPADVERLRPRAAFARSPRDLADAIAFARLARSRYGANASGDLSLQLAAAEDHPLETRYFMAIDAAQRYSER